MGFEVLPIITSINSQVLLYEGEAHLGGMCAHLNIKLLKILLSDFTFLPVRSTPLNNDFCSSIQVRLNSRIGLSVFADARCVL